MRKHWSTHLFVVAVLALAMGSDPGSARAKAPEKGNLLYMTLCKGYHHRSILLSEQIVKQLGEKSGAFQVTVTGW
ncbi:MAG: hypothetical protein ACLQVL_27245 [Terriglobia bacterium]